MRYISTRDSSPQPASFSEILLEGLARDGGLYVPEHYPALDSATLSRWVDVLEAGGYAALAAEVLTLFAPEIPRWELERLTSAAYTAEAFGSRGVVGVSALGGEYAGLHLAHLSNGPTAAFKDMAMQLLGQLFEYELDRRGATLTILGATSGDTGSAAEYAMAGRAGIGVVMLSPRGRMTPFQQAQMFTIKDPRIVNVAVSGVFDDCQDLVKAVNADADFKERHRIGAVNSINWARIVAQVVYYVAAYLRTVRTVGEEVSFAVPTGNFGNILAGHVAREMGLPIGRLVLATNENNVLDEFFRTGRYRPRSAAQTHETSSPSMDISKASNFERFIFDVLGRDGERVGELFGRRLVREGQFDLSGSAEFAQLGERYGFLSGSSSHQERVRTIRELYRSQGVLVDPHTADGLAVARRCGVGGPIVVLETALPIKFAATIAEAIGEEPAVPERFRALAGAEHHVVELENDVAALKALIEERSPFCQG